jgi:hypothetical protein
VFDPPALGSIGPKEEEGCYKEGQRLVLSNQYLDWELVMMAGGIKVSVR